ncbi:unnamed protein product [Larinioides sclopetarius]|uniref:Uncharacterized protein n=1 Tax=Larinioides sclopetarius TaxID=280406 RepID=A0AAV1ZML9_9ARAC
MAVVLGCQSYEISIKSLWVLYIPAVSNQIKVHKNRSLEKFLDQTLDDISAMIPTSNDKEDIQHSLKDLMESIGNLLISFVKRIVKKTLKELNFRVECFICADSQHI